MHIFAGIIILVGFLSQFVPLTETPKGTIDLMTTTANTSSLKTKVTPMEVFASKGISQQGYDYSCGSAALSTLLNGQFGETFTEKQVIQGLMEYGDAKLIAKRRAFSLLDMKEFVGKLGYKGNGYKASIQDLKELKQPGILPIKIFNYRHFVVFKGIHKNHVFLADPWRGHISFEIREFEDKWYENVIFLITDNSTQEWNRLSLTEKDLRFIDEDDVRKLMSDQLNAPPVLLDRSNQSGPATTHMYKR